MNIKKLSEKTTLPIAIVIAALILGVAFYAVQANKQESIERQQLIKIQEDRKKEEAKEEKEREEKRFANELKCQSLLDGLKERWYNVVGIYYSEWQNTCIVKYTENGEVEESPIETMADR